MRAQGKPDLHGPDPVRAAVVPRMEALLRRLAARKDVRHAVLGVSSLDGSWAWSDAAGAATTDGFPMTLDTPWFLASVTKLYIAAVVLRLYEQGRMDLDAPIAAYLPSDLSGGLHVLDGVDYTERITVTHLLGHSSGLPDWLDERPPGRRSLIEEVIEQGDRAWSFEEAATRARDLLTPHFPPSDPSAAKPRIRYCDTNYQLLMVMVQHVTGQPMSRTYRQLFFDPLDLRQTWLPGERPPAAVREPATVWLGDRAFDDRPLAMQSFGDLFSTVDDVLRFGRLLVTGALFENTETAGLMYRRFRRFGFPRGVAALRAPSWPIEYGLGMMRFAPSRLLAGGRRIPGVIGHTGSTGSWLWICPELRLVIAGTVDQAQAAAVPFRLLPRFLTGLAG